MADFGLYAIDFSMFICFQSLDFPKMKIWKLLRDRPPDLNNRQYTFGPRCPELLDWWGIYCWRATTLAKTWTKGSNNERSQSGCKGGQKYFYQGALFLSKPDTWHRWTVSHLYNQPIYLFSIGAYCLIPTTCGLMEWRYARYPILGTFCSRV